jgi:membrane-bound lytic murein transglycosylase D
VEEVIPDSPLEFDSLELETPTHISLVAGAVDRPVGELRELNPALLKSVAPAGYRLHVPKGTLDRLEEAFAVIPPNRRDSWRVERVESGDTLVTMARRYGTTAEAIRAANRDLLPDAGGFVAIPMAYAGDRAIAAKRSTAARSVHNGTSQASSKKSVAAVISGTPQKKPMASKAAPKQSASAQKTSVRNVSHRAPGA